MVRFYAHARARFSTKSLRQKNNQDKALFGGSERGRFIKQYFILIVFQILVQMRGLEPPRPEGH